jgi:ribose 5-phosphate isomerase B
MTWLVDHGYEVVDHGPFVHDPSTTTRFCLRAAAGWAGSVPRAATASAW